MLTNFRTYHLAISLYHSITPIKLPRHLKDQILRAGSSIALNLAEGSGKETDRDKRKFYRIAYGSLKEVHAVLMIANISSHDEEIDKLGAHLWKLIKYHESV